MVDAYDCTCKIFGGSNGTWTAQYSDQATDWMTKESGFNSWQGTRFLFFTASTLAVGFTQLPIGWVLGTLCSGLEADCSLAQLLK